MLAEKWVDETVAMTVEKLAAKRAGTMEHGSVALMVDLMDVSLVEK
jgi:hypothetical protein